MAKSAKGRGRGSRRSSPKAARGGRTQQPKAAEPVKISDQWQFAKSMAAAAAGPKPAKTIVYVHGIGNKPKASVLKCQWDTALLGKKLGDRSRMAYWVNRDYYPVPLDTTCAVGDKIPLEDGDELSIEAISAMTSDGASQEVLNLDREIEALTTDATRQQWLHRIAEKMASGAEPRSAELEPGQVRAKIVPLPPLFRRWITRKITRVFLRDVNDFFFNKDRRKVMEDSLIERLRAGGGPFVVVGHSQGSMIAYDVLRQLQKADCEVSLFITIGSPLGLDEVQDIFRQWTGRRLPFPACVDR